jgi:hypothetical protein
LENFTAVGRVGLLRSLYRDRCSWTVGVQSDIQPRLLVRPDLQEIDASWLGEPIEETDPDGVRLIDLIRRTLGGSTLLPRQHLAESQAIYHVSHVEKNAIFATDDRGAYSMAVRRGLTVIDTPDILSACYEAGLLACPEAYDLLLAMAAAGRGVAIPETHAQICPPRPAGN